MTYRQSSKEMFPSSVSDADNSLLNTKKDLGKSHEDDRTHRMRNLCLSKGTHFLFLRHV
eukprot:c3484_g1_i1 orf=2-175(-)